MTFHKDGRLHAALFVTPEPLLLSREHLGRLVGEDARDALAGRPPAGLPDPGPTVCACLNVGLKTILGAMAGGAQSVEAIGAALGAGTNCGSCRPELASLLAHHAPGILPNDPTADNTSLPALPCIFGRSGSFRR